MEKYVIGIDFGSDSCRAVVIDAKKGWELSNAVCYYPRWKAGWYCDAANSRYRQHPSDYIETMEIVVNDSLQKLDHRIREKIVGISIDTTGSTPVLTDENGTPLALLPDFEEDPDAMFVLWKDHTAIQEASEINALVKRWTPDYTAYGGGIYSSEWVWAKVLHLLRSNERVQGKAYSWVEHCDWMTALLVGDTAPERIHRSRCAAGHKAMWNERWGGLPAEEFLVTLDPLLAGFRSHLYTQTFTGDQKAGYLCPEWQERLGLSGEVAISVGGIDAHVGAVGACIRPYVLTRIMGTSTCDILIVPREDIEERLVPGICGQVDGSVVPGYIGMEAGQSAFGDVYAWLKGLLSWIWNISERVGQEDILDRIIPLLSEAAAKIDPATTELLALDWLNGRRTPDANQALKGAVTGLTLATTAPELFRALVEATAFGAKAITERFRREKIRIDSIIATGGISLKAPFVMQVLADVLNMPIQVMKSEQTCALGAAMFAAVAAGVYGELADAQQAMNAGVAKIYIPDPNRTSIYAKRYKRYLKLASFVEGDTGQDKPGLNLR